jgi:hypothetical protein
MPFQLPSGLRKETAAVSWSPPITIAKHVPNFSPKFFDHQIPGRSLAWPAALPLVPGGRGGRPGARVTRACVPAGWRRGRESDRAGRGVARGCLFRAAVARGRRRLRCARLAARRILAGTTRRMGRAHRDDGARAAVRTDGDDDWTRPIGHGGRSSIGLHAVLVLRGDWWSGGRLAWLLVIVGWLLGACVPSRPLPRFCHPMYGCGRSNVDGWWCLLTDAQYRDRVGA